MLIRHATSDRPPLISLCIANYNGVSVIDDCLRSILSQDATLPIEIIIHDDASTDDSVAYIRNHYPDVILIQSHTNVGFCIANNRMAAMAGGEYLLLLNNDAALFPDALSTLLKTSSELDKPAILSLPQFDFASGELIDRGCLLDPFYNPIPNIDPHRQEVAMVIGACLWIPKTLWERIEGFPQWFGSIGEDLYLCCKARLLGYSVRVTQVSGYRHRVGASFGGGKVTEERRLVTSYRRRALTERNKTYVLAMTCPAPAIFLLLPLHLLLLFVEGVLLAILQRRSTPFRRIYWPVYTALVRNRKQLLEGRRSMMSKPGIRLCDFFSVFRIIPYKLMMWLRYGLPEIR